MGYRTSSLSKHEASAHARGRESKAEAARLTAIESLGPVVSFIVLALFLAHASSAWGQPTDRPNVVFFLADDMGWGDTRVNNPNSKIPMPNLEQLAESGMNFTDAHTSAAKCAPTRYSALSGNYHWRGKLPWGHWPWYGGTQFLPGQETIADVAKSAGYTTAMIGKMHLGGDLYIKNSNTFAEYGTPTADLDIGRGLQNGPRTYGFDYTFTVPRGIQKEPYAYFENDKLLGNVSDLFQWQPGTYGRSVIKEAGIGMPYFDTSAVGPMLLQRALRFIDLHHLDNSNNGTDRPFFMFYSPQAAHAPWTPPATMNGQPVDGATGTNNHLDMIYELDVALGALVNSLAERDLLDNTLIVFTSDNGGIGRLVDRQLGHDTSGGFRGAKGMIWEGGHRVPFVVRWGDGTARGSRIAPGSESRQLIGLHDLMATFAALVDEPLETDQARDSFNFLPVLLGDQTESEPIRNHIIMEADFVDGVQGPRQFAYREGIWKLIFSVDGDPIRLHNMSADPDENDNEINSPQHAARVAAMTTRFRARRVADRTAPIYGDDDPDCGSPPIDFATDRGLFVWRECNTNNWRVAAAGGANSDGNRTLTTFRGNVQASATLSNLADPGGSLESSDRINLSSDGRRVDFVLRLLSGYGSSDRFRFDANAEGSLCLSIQVENAADQIYLGQSRKIISNFPTNLRTGRPCNNRASVECGSPNINRATDRGLFLWVDCASSRWELSAVGGANDPFGNRRFTEHYGGLDGSNTPRNVDTNTLEPGTDRMTVVGNRIDFTLKTASGYNGIDRIRFDAPSTTSYCLRLQAGSDPLAVHLGANRALHTAFPLAIGDPNACQ